MRRDAYHEDKTQSPALEKPPRPASRLDQPWRAPQSHHFNLSLHPASDISRPQRESGKSPGATGGDQAGSRIRVTPRRGQRAGASPAVRPKVGSGWLQSGHGWAPGVAGTSSSPCAFIGLRLEGEPGRRLPTLLGLQDPFNRTRRHHTSVLHSEGATECELASLGPLAGREGEF